MSDEPTVNPSDDLADLDDPNMLPDPGAERPECPGAEDPNDVPEEA